MMETKILNTLVNKFCLIVVHVVKVGYLVCFVMVDIHLLLIFEKINTMSKL